METLADDIVSSDLLTEGVDDKNILRAIFLAGAGGSGKSKIADDMFAGLGFKVINQDKHLARILAAADIPLSKVGMHYSLQKKAQRLKNAEVRQYGLRRLGMVIDSTGWDFPRIAEPMTKLKKLGYDCYMVFVSTSLETALKRNAARAAAGDRDVPKEFIEKAWKGAHDNLPDFKTLFGDQNVFVINNDREINDAAWSRIVAPALRKLAGRILKAPLKNPIGKAWLAKKVKGGPDTVNTKEWPKPEEPTRFEITKKGVEKDGGYYSNASPAEPPRPRVEAWMLPSRVQESLLDS